MKDKVYFAHPISTYNSDAEQAGIEKIRSLLGDVEIVNPAKVTQEDITECHDASPWVKNKFALEMVKLYFPLIASCKYFAYAADPNTGKMTTGVRYELDYAKRINREIINLME